MSSPVSILVAAFHTFALGIHLCLFIVIFCNLESSPKPTNLSFSYNHRMGAKSHVGVSTCRWDKYAIVGKGYAKMDPQITTKMHGELFEAGPPSLLQKIQYAIRCSGKQHAASRIPVQ